MQLKVTAHLSSPLAGDAPYLDSILENEMAHRQGLARKVRRCDAAPPEGAVHIPMLRGSIGGRSVPRCSAPIMSPTKEWTEHVAKRLGVEHSDLLQEDRRLVVAMGNAVYKSYRLPLRLRQVDRVVWFCVGHRRPILKLLRSVTSLGQKRAAGYGRIERWEAVELDGDYSWFVDSPGGPLLMRNLPLCDALPAGLIGARRDFGACSAPYWHRDRYGEIVTPC